MQQLANPFDYTPEEKVEFANYEKEARGGRPAAEPAEEPADDNPVLAEDAEPETREAAPHAPPPAPADDDDDDPIPADFSPKEQALYASSRKERKKRQELERKIAERDAAVAAERATMQERLNVLTAIMQGRQAEPEQAQPPAPQAPPSPEDDIFEAFKAEVAERQRLGQETASIKAQFEQLAQRAEAERHQQAVAQTVYRAEAEFQAKTPDYQAAINHLRNARLQQLVMGGVPEQAARERIVAEAFQLATIALQRGLDPAQFAYDYSKSYGYQPPAPAAQATPPTPPRNADGKFKPSASEQIETATRAQKANTSLSAAPGSAGPSGPLDITQLTKMSDEEFKAWVEKDIKSKNKLSKSVRGLGA